MGWDVARPSTLLRSSDRTWYAGSMFRKVQPGDMICVYMKNIPKHPDGVYIVGTIRKIGLEDGASFSWSVDQERSAKVLLAPILKATVRKFFPRSYGGSLQPLAQRYTSAWLSLLGRANKVFKDAPIVPVRRAPKRGQVLATGGDPTVSRENGLKGEKYVVALLKRDYSERDGYRVEHVAASNPGADHDIVITKAGKLVRAVEVKTRFGKPPAPVIISERELDCRRQNKARHSIYIVYLDKSGTVHSTLLIGRKDAFALAARQYWLQPGAV
jgi:uncharacterized protein DUF3883